MQLTKDKVAEGNLGELKGVTEKLYWQVEPMMFDSVLVVETMTVGSVLARTNQKGKKVDGLNNARN